MEKQVTPTPKQAEEAHLLEILATISPPVYKTIDIADMVLTDINPVEGVSRKWVDFFAHHWSDALGSPFLVVEQKAGRRTIYPVLDGRHRKQALHQRGNRRYRIGALVYEGLDQQQMAAIFAYWNLMRRNVSPMEKFTSSVMHGSPLNVPVDKVLKELELEGKVNCYATLTEMVAGAETLEEGEQAVRFSLTLLSTVFPDDPRRFNQRIVKGVGRFYNRYWDHPNFDPSDLPARIQKGRYRDAKTLLDWAEVYGGNQGASFAVMRYLQERHDAGRKSKRLED